MAFDSKGNTTNNAKEALKGTMAPSGGYKGFGTGLMVEILTACISGGNLGTQASSFAGEDGGPPSTGQFFIAINGNWFFTHSISILPLEVMTLIFPRHFLLFLIQILYLYHTIN